MGSCDGALGGNVVPLADRCAFRRCPIPQRRRTRQASPANHRPAQAGTIGETRLEL